MSETLVDPPASSTHRRAALGFAGMSIGNVLIAAGNWLSNASVFLAGVSVVAAIGLAILAFLWWFRPENFDLESIPLGATFPTVLLAGGIVLPLVGGVLVAAALAG